MNDHPRLIEVAFPLKQASLDSVHEKNVRHGHISTLHIWPARRPLAACRAALIATLLPDPRNAEERRILLEKIGGKVVKKIEKKKIAGRVVEVEKEVTVGGVLHWGREDSPDMEWFRQEIRKAYGGRAPKVLDPFAGGGAIPLEAMRLGCEATAIDLNPVAWFILKCTLEYPQRLAGQKRPLPEFILDDEEFMEAFYKAHPGLIGTGKPTKKQFRTLFDHLQEGTLDAPEADLAWHVRAWGKWVLNQAREDLARFYPIYADFEPLIASDRPYERRERRLVPLNDDGTPDNDALNAEFSPDYLEDRRNPRWVAKPTVAYLWARTVKCKNCRATVPLLKTRWLCRKDNKRVVLTMEPNADKTGVAFGVEPGVPQVGGNAAQRREHDRRIAAGTMNRSGVTCPCCEAIMTMQDIQLEGQAGRLHSEMTAVVVDGPGGKEYRRPTPDEIQAAQSAEQELGRVFSNIPFGPPDEQIVEDAKRNTWCVQYGLDRFSKLFGPRQLVSLGSFVRDTRSVVQAMGQFSYPGHWIEAVTAFLAVALDRLADYGSSGTHWGNGGEFVVSTFQRFALPVNWDFCEVNFTASLSGSYESALGWVSLVCSHTSCATTHAPAPSIARQSAIKSIAESTYDLILTDPPYYNAIGYSVLMDFFYVWLRRAVWGITAEIEHEFSATSGPKWDAEASDGELVDDASRHNGDPMKSKATYEDGMFRAFQSCQHSLKPDGRIVVVFANKQPDAWETLVSAVIRAGFVVDGSWPIQTERAARTRSLSSAALASSVWLVCKNRPATARPGWDNKVLEEMREKIHARLREYWDAGIRGPDFVWAATGPAMEAYSKHPVVKKANEPGKVMEVSEFLRHVRRIVVDFVVGRVLTHNGDEQTVSGLDDVTTYYLLHRNDFKLADAPIGPCILYAVSCGLSDGALADQYDILARTGGKETAAEDAENAEETAADETDAEEEEGTGSKVKLKAWYQRKRPGMGYDPSADSPRVRRRAGQPTLFEGAEPIVVPREVPMIDKVHRLMHLWRAGDVVKVDEYIDCKALRKNSLFVQLLQALIELADEGSEERSLLETISNHLAARGRAPAEEVKPFAVMSETE